MGAIPSAFLAQLAEVVGPQHVLTDRGVTAGYCVDWTGRYRGSTPAVVRPGSTVEVSAVVELCARTGVAVVPQGGNTGLVAGAVPLDHELLLSLRRLSVVGPAEPGAGQVTAGAGATVTQVQLAATEAGWEYAVDFASRDSATVGGSIATNAGGSRVLRHGDTRAQVVGIEAVLGDGSVVSHLGGLVKDNTGYHLPSLLCGSEGTLGVVTSARLRLVPRTRDRVAALLAFSSAGAAVDAAGLLRRDVGSLEALELFLHHELDLVCDTLRLPRPFTESHPAYLLVEVAGRGGSLEDVSDAVASINGLADTAVATDAPRRAQLWRYREGITEAINSVGPPHKLDVTLPTDQLAAFIAEVPAVVASVPRASAAATWLFGHVGDGNVHVNVTGLAPHDDAVDAAVLHLVAGMGGSISAEHGIGRAKRPWLGLGRSEAEIAAFRAIKRALDPVGILNPNVLLPPLGPN